MYDTNVAQIVRDWYILCFAWKWHGDKKVRVEALPDFKDSYKRNKYCDKKLAERLWKILDEADIVIAHNGNGFDIPKIQARLFLHKFTPPSDFQVVDTLQVARRNFRLSSNKLGEVSKALGLGVKEDSGGFSTWVGCMNGDRKAWATMKKYNKMDVDLLEKVYEAVRPWHKTHPNIAVFDPEYGCPRCGSNKVKKWGKRRTRTYEYQRMRCEDCGSYSRVRLSDKEHPKPLLVP